MIVVLLALGCGVEPAVWTDAVILAGARARADRDHDGKIEVAELDGDRDGDGVVGDAELRRVVEAAGASWQLPGWAPATPLPPPVARPSVAWQVLHTVREEVLAADPAAVVPSEEEIEGLRSARGLDGPAGRDLVGRLRVAAAAAGVALPDDLVGPPEGSRPAGGPRGGGPGGGGHPPGAPQ